MTKKTQQQDSAPRRRCASAAELVLVVSLAKTVDPKNWDVLLYRLAQERAKRKEQQRGTQ